VGAEVDFTIAGHTTVYVVQGGLLAVCRTQLRPGKGHSLENFLGTEMLSASAVAATARMVELNIISPSSMYGVIRSYGVQNAVPGRGRFIGISSSPARCHRTLGKDLQRQRRQEC
jgi:hypothetical protein